MGISKVPTDVPYNKYSFSDIFEEKNDPFDGKDPDSFISQDLQGEPWIGHNREFEIEGREGAVRHLIALLVSLHDKHEYLRQRDRYTGVFVNHQEDGRLEDGANGHEFYVVELDNNIRIVASPVSDLCRVDPNRITSIHRVPNINGIYDADEQFRSQYTPILLARDHQHQEDLESADPAVIEQDPRHGTFRGIFVDKYKNVLGWREGGLQEQIDLLRQHEGRTIGVQFGNGEQREVLVASSLAKGPAGRFIVYPNGDNIDFAGKWGPQFSKQKKREQSAFEKAGRPIENVTSISFEW